MRRPLIAGNWKMYKTAAQAKELMAQLVPLIADVNVEAVVCPPFTALETVKKLIAGTKLALGAQDVYWEDEGAFTGEVSAPMLASIGCTYCIVGHSERRQYFAETNETVNKKINALLQHNLTPIVCVGESLAQREQGITRDVCRQQLEQGLAGLNKEAAAKLVIAYEPVWAIGTGQTATADQAQEVIGYLRTILAEQFGQDTAELIRIQYGGSVKPGNVAELMEKPDIDGALVGGASLKAEDFAAIIQKSCHK
ncbi:triose-phosphate isomerase [Bacillota bacterium LX-D]|nr:triose-phosphate isomerase [Bacillota bacterium LX-D]